MSSTSNALDLSKFTVVSAGSLATVVQLIGPSPTNEGTSTPITINWNTPGIHKAAPAGAALTVNFSNATDGQIVNFVLTNSASLAITWGSGGASSIVWAGSATPPTPSATGKVDIYTFLKVGSTIYGSARQNF